MDTAEPPDGPGAVFVVRVWFESAATGAGFRARITQAVDPRGPDRSVVVADPAQVRPGGASGGGSS